MTFIDFFAGVGGFRKGMENAGHTCVGFCEWDKYARASYISMHLITDEQRAYLATLDLKQRQKEILKDEYLNGEFCSTDVRLVTGDTVPRADCWCYGAPCQDFSVAGKRAGLDGDRSSLIREIYRILGELKEDDRPEWLIYENVKGMLSSNQGRDYLEILLEMDELGYDAEWFVFNSKYHGVPQNRERVYTVGHLRSRGSAKVFPIKGADREDSVEGLTPVKQIGNRKCYRRNTQIFDPSGATEALDTAGGGGRGHHVIVLNRDTKHDWQNVIDAGGGWNDSNGERLQSSETSLFGIDKGVRGKERDVANTISAREDRGVSERKQEGTAVCIRLK